jgi:hypothetical protein
MNEEKNRLNMETGSRNMNNGNPTSAATRDIIATQMPRDGILRRENLLLSFEDDGTLSRTQPTGQRNLQKKFLSNQPATNTTQPIMFRKTKDFNANTELSIIKGLIQTEIPEKDAQPRGSAKRIVRNRKKYRIFLLLTKVHFLIE